MKILIISNIYLSAQKLYSGIFIKNQYVEIYTIKIILILKIGSVLKYFKAFILFFPLLLISFFVGYIIQAVMLLLFIALLLNYSILGKHTYV